MIHRLFLSLLVLTGPAIAQDGGQLYSIYCSACHGADGKGATGGAFPPLAQSPWVAGEAERSIKVVLNGLHGPVDVLGKTYNLEMPPQGAVLPDDQIAAILTHVRASWGNQAGPVTTELVKATRAAVQNRQAPWTAEELLKLHPLPLEKTALTELTSQVYKGDWKYLPDFATLKAENIEEEHDGIITLADSKYKDRYAMVWEGKFHAPVASDEYFFSLDADDAAKILLDGENILEIHGIGPMNGSRTQRCKLTVTQGTHSIRVEYLQHTGEQGISIGWKSAASEPFRWLTEQKEKTKKGLEPIDIAPVGDRPVIYRNFITGTSPRAIGVGFPGGLNLAYSADHLAPELIWTGKFINGAPKWLQRGTDPSPPAGEKLVTLNKARFLPAEARFKGYKLDSIGNPTFSTQIGKQILLDSWSVQSGALVRKLTLTSDGNSVSLPLGNHPELIDLPTEITVSPGKPVTLTYRWK